MKILVVHRQKEVVTQVRTVLQKTEPFIRYSNSGLDGLLVARVETFDLIICGTDLPVITGFELVRSIRTNSVNRTTTIVFLADEINYKVEYLSGALGVAGSMIPNDLSLSLMNFVNKDKMIKDDGLLESFPETSLN